MNNNVIHLFLDCFETNLAVKHPLLAAELLDVFGAIVCGSQVNIKTNIVIVGLYISSLWDYKT